MSVTDRTSALVCGGLLLLSQLLTQTLYAEGGRLGFGEGYCTSAK